jgi:hypothetical protein
MELIAELEQEKRGVYAGAVGYFGYGSVDGDKETEGAMDVSGVCLVWALQAADLCRRALRYEPCWSRTASRTSKQG